MIASTSNDMTLRLWNVESGDQLVMLRGHQNLAIRPAFRFDSKLIATVSWDGSVIMWGIPSEG